MSAKVEAKLAALERLGASELKAEWLQVIKTDPPKIAAALMRLAIAYRLQERAFGGMSAKTRRRMTVACGGTSGLASLKPGTRLLRSWNGRTIEVLVTDVGYEHRGKTYRSLSQIAREVTGTVWSGPRFFGLNASD